MRPRAGKPDAPPPPYTIAFIRRRIVQTLNIRLTGALCRPAPRRLPASRMPETLMTAIRQIKRAGITVPGSDCFSPLQKLISHWWYC